MNILCLSPTFLPVVGGAELVLWEVYRRLATRHNVLLLTPELNKQLLDNYSKNAEDYPINFRVVRYKDRITFMSIRGHRLSGGLIPPFSISAIFALKTALQSFQPDVINVHYTMPTGLAAGAANTLWNIPTILTLNGRDVPGPGVPPLWKYWHRLIARLCTEITYVSEYCREVVFGPDDPGIVTWNGVDFDNIKIEDAGDLREKLNFEKDAKVIFALQRLSKEKRVDVLLEAMKYIVQRAPNCYLIIGGTGPEKENLVKQVHRLNIFNNVLFAGFIPDADIGAYFNLCDIFMFNSTYETFGIVLAQAMAYGKPIVSVKNTAIPGVVKDGECGLLVESNQPQRMAEAAVQLLIDPQMRKAMGARGHERAKTLFDWDIVASKYEKIFQTSVAKRS